MSADNKQVSPFSGSVSAKRQGAQESSQGAWQYRPRVSRGPSTDGRNLAMEQRASQDQSFSAMLLSASRNRVRKAAPSTSSTAAETSDVDQSATPARPMKRQRLAVYEPPAASRAEDAPDRQVLIALLASTLGDYVDCASARSVAQRKALNFKLATKLDRLLGEASLSAVLGTVLCVTRAGGSQPADSAGAASLSQPGSASSSSATEANSTSLQTNTPDS